MRNATHRLENRMEGDEYGKMKINEKKNLVKSALFTLDFVLLNLIYYYSLLYLVRVVNYHEVMTMVMVITITFFSFRLYNMYVELEHIRFREIVVKSFIANMVSVAGAGIVLTLRQDYGEKMMLTVFPITFLITTTTRIMVKKYITSRYKKANILIIGRDEDIRDIVKKFFLKYFRTYNISWIAPEALTPEAYENRDEVLVSQNILPDTKEAIVAEILRRHLTYRIIPGNYEILVAASHAGQIYDTFIFNKMATARFLYRFAKRGMDLLGGGFLFLLSLPLMAGAALALKLESPGAPILYVQDRVTMNDRVFRLYKFRSMVPDAEEGTGAVLAERNDARITRVGSILRTFRIDELPQVLNVLKGDMSLVGPRPERPEFVQRFNRELPLYDYRHRVRAGLSGLAQISGYYSTTAADKLKHDLYYVEQHSIILDVVILLRTLEVILSPSKSAGLEEQQTLEEVLAARKYRIEKDGQGYHFIREEGVRK